MFKTEDDNYLQTKDGYFVAWPTTVPCLHAEWMAVQVSLPARKRRLVIVPIRPLSAAEMARINELPVLLWGMKVPDREWALVLCRPSVAPWGGGSLGAVQVGV